MHFNFNTHQLTLTTVYYVYGRYLRVICILCTYHYFRHNEFVFFDDNDDADTSKQRLRIECVCVYSTNMQRMQCCSQTNFSRT